MTDPPAATPMRTVTGHRRLNPTPADADRRTSGRANINEAVRRFELFRADLGRELGIAPTPWLEHLVRAGLHPDQGAAVEPAGRATR
ncbi:hypothetical protein [Micromonospora cremea]|uniref:hypothetical protein n=1 Tax=Micromonospora cremea TaxID=709881 RepID=UPI0009418C80|nr:hypothetical protein [Micromonospora cremea]